jgi:hypothetical protein
MLNPLNFNPILFHHVVVQNHGQLVDCLGKIPTATARQTTFNDRSFFARFQSAAQTFQVSL